MSTLASTLGALVAPPTAEPGRAIVPVSPEGFAALLEAAAGASPLVATQLGTATTNALATPHAPLGDARESPSAGDVPSTITKRSDASTVAAKTTTNATTTNATKTPNAAATSSAAAATTSPATKAAPMAATRETATITSPHEDEDALAAPITSRTSTSRAPSERVASSLSSRDRAPAPIAMRALERSDSPRAAVGDARSHGASTVARRAQGPRTPRAALRDSEARVDPPPRHPDVAPPIVASSDPPELAPIAFGLAPTHPLATAAAHASTTPLRLFEDALDAGARPGATRSSTSTSAVARAGARDARAEDTYGPTRPLAADDDAHDATPEAEPELDELAEGPVAADAFAPRAFAAAPDLGRAARSRSITRDAAPSAAPSTSPSSPRGEASGAEVVAASLLGRSKPGATAHVASHAAARPHPAASHAAKARSTAKEPESREELDDAPAQPEAPAHPNERAATSKRSGDDVIPRDATPASDARDGRAIENSAPARSDAASSDATTSAGDTEAGHAVKGISPRSSGSTESAPAEARTSAHGDATAAHSSEPRPPAAFASEATKGGHVSAREGSAASAGSPVDAPRAEPSAAHATAELHADRLALRRGTHAEVDVPELGRVRVEARANERAVDVSVVAQRADAAAWLSASRDDLARHLVRSDVALGDLRVGRDAMLGGDRGTSGDGGARRGAPEHGAPSDDEPRDEPAHRFTASRWRSVL